MQIWSAEIKKLCSFILLALLINTFCLNTLKGNDLINSYDVFLELNPNNQGITAEIKLDLNLLNSGNDTLVFFLHKELSITSVESGHSLSYDFLKDQECPYFYMKNARPLKIIFEQEYNENVIIHLKYQGPLKDIAWETTNMLTTNWIELGTYSAWFPYNPEYVNEIFNEWINYKAFSSGFAEPVIGHDNNIRSSYSTRYDKGPVALCYLENLLGKEKFIEVLKRINEHEITTTDELLNKLKELISQKVIEQFEEELKK